MKRKCESFNTKDNFQTLDQAVKLFFMTCIFYQIPQAPGTLIWNMMTNPSVHKVVNESAVSVRYYITMLKNFKTQDIMPEVLMGGSYQYKQSKRLKTIDGESYLELSF